MNIPSYVETKVVDDKGSWSLEWRQIITQLLNQLVTNVGTEGFIVSNLTATQITYLTTAPNSLANGTIFYDSTNDLLKTIIAGAVKTITTS